MQGHIYIHRYRCASYCRMRTWVPGLPACMACMRVSGTLCLSCVRAQRAGTNTQTHTYAHMRSISREEGVYHSFTAASLRVDQPDEFFRVPAHTYHPGSALAGASSCAFCEAGKYSQDPGASSVCLLRRPPFPPRSLACVDITHTRVYACAEGASGILLHACAYA